MDLDVLLVMHTALLLLDRARLLRAATRVWLGMHLLTDCVSLARPTSSTLSTVKHVFPATATATLALAVPLWAASNATRDTCHLHLVDALHALLAANTRLTVSLALLATVNARLRDLAWRMSGARSAMLDTNPMPLADAVRVWVAARTRWTDSLA